MKHAMWPFRSIGSSWKPLPRHLGHDAPACWWEQTTLDWWYPGDWWCLEHLNGGVTWLTVVEGNLHPQFFGQRIVGVIVSGLLVMTWYWILHQLHHSLLYLHDIPETLKEVKTLGPPQSRSGGILAFYMHFTSFIEWNWRSPVRTYISSLYFCTYTMTSVGYGDIGPKNLGDFEGNDSSESCSLISFHTIFKLIPL